MRKLLKKIKPKKSTVDIVVKPEGTHDKDGHYTPTGNKPKSKRALSTQLRTKLLDYCMEMDLDGNTNYVDNRSGKVITIREIPKKDILKIAGSMVPKSLNVNETKKTISSINVKVMKDNDLNAVLLKRLSQRGGTGNELLEHEEDTH